SKGWGGCTVAALKYPDCTAGTSAGTPGKGEIAKALESCPAFSRARSSATCPVAPSPPVIPMGFCRRSLRVFICDCAINDQRTVSEENQTARAGIPLKVALTVAGPTPPRYSTCSAAKAGMDNAKGMPTSYVV